MDKKNRKEEKNMVASVKPIDKTNKTGLTKEKKEILKSHMGSASVNIDLNKVREWWKNETD